MPALTISKYVSTYSFHVSSASISFSAALTATLSVLCRVASEVTVVISGNVFEIFLIVLTCRQHTNIILGEMHLFVLLNIT